METTPSSSPTSESALRQDHTLVQHLEASTVFRDYQRAFQSLTGLPLVLRAAGSFQVALSGARLRNPFCALLTAHNKTCGAALQFQDRLEAAARVEAATLESFAGLFESAVPLLVGEQLIGYLHTGQVLYRMPTTAEARRAAREIHQIDPAIPAAELEAAYLETRVMPRAQYEAALRVLGFFADQLSALSNQLMVQQNLAEPPAIARARQYIAEHQTEEVTLHDVARHVGMSSFYFCKNFHQATGLTFTDYLARLRVESVKQLLLDPNKRVSEAAYEAGFQSLSQFNRVFHRVAGQAPSDYREHLHAPAPAPAGRRPRAVAA